MKFTKAFLNRHDSARSLYSGPLFSDSRIRWNFTSSTGVQYAFRVRHIKAKPFGCTLRVQP